MLEQFVGVEWFRHVQVGAGILALLPVVGLALRGEQDDVRAIEPELLLDRAADVEAVALRHHHVEEYEYRPVLLDDGERLVAVTRGEQFDAVVLELLERLLDEQPDVLLVVDDEDGRHGSSWKRLGPGFGETVETGADRESTMPESGARCNPARWAGWQLQTATLPDVRPMRSLALLSIAHAVNHAHAIVLPLIFLQLIDEYGVGIDAIAFLAAIGNLSAGLVQLSYAQLTRVVARRRLLGGGGLLLGGGFIARRSPPAS